MPAFKPAAVSLGSEAEAQAVTQSYVAGYRRARAG